jgi:hypothetical protein
VPKYDVIFVDEDGTEWIEVKVVLFIFESAATGITTRQIAQILTDKGIPTPTVTKGNRVKEKDRPPSLAAFGYLEDTKK